MYKRQTQWGAGIDPLGIRYCLNEIYDRYQKPLFVIENGMGAVDILGPPMPPTICLLRAATPLRCGTRLKESR